jgi:hypothetical protein
VPWGDDDQLAGPEVAVAGAQLQTEADGDDEEQLVLGAMVVPDELTATSMRPSVA